MINSINLDDPTFYGDVILASLKKSEMGFSVTGVVNDLIPVIETNLTLVTLPPASIVHDSSKRYNCDKLSFASSTPTVLLDILEDNLKSVGIPAANIVLISDIRTNEDLLNFNSELPNSLILNIDDTLLDYTLFGKTALGFSTTDNRLVGWNSEVNIIPVGELNYGSQLYNDLLSISETSLTSSGSIPNSDIPKIKYSDGDINFYAVQLGNVNTFLMHEDNSIPLTGTLPELNKLKTIPVAGNALNEYTFIILNESLTKIIHKSDLPIGAFAKAVQTDGNYIQVVAIAKDNTKPNYVFKQIDISGVPS